MGDPRYVASTILSISHVQSLKMETKTAAPGEKHCIASYCMPTELS